MLEVLLELESRSFGISPDSGCSIHVPGLPVELSDNFWEWSPDRCRFLALPSQSQRDALHLRDFVRSHFTSRYLFRFDLQLVHRPCKVPPFPTRSWEPLDHLPDWPPLREPIRDWYWGNSEHLGIPTLHEFDINGEYIVTQYTWHTPGSRFVLSYQRAATPLWNDRQFASRTPSLSLCAERSAPTPTSPPASTIAPPPVVFFSCSPCQFTTLALAHGGLRRFIKLEYLPQYSGLIHLCMSSERDTESNSRPSTRSTQSPLLEQQFNPNLILRNQSSHKKKKSSKTMTDSENSSTPARGANATPAPPRGAHTTASATVGPVSLTYEQLLGLMDRASQNQAKALETALEKSAETQIANFETALKRAFPQPMATPPSSPESLRDLNKMRQAGIARWLVPNSQITPKEAFMAEGVTEEEAHNAAVNLRASDLNATTVQQHLPTSHARAGEAPPGTRVSPSYVDFLNGGSPPHFRVETLANTGPDTNNFHQDNMPRRSQSGSPYEARHLGQEHQPLDGQEGRQDTSKPVFRTEDLGIFDGKSDKYGFWLAHVSALVLYRPNDAAWHDAIIRCLPFCLRDGAKFWYTSLDENTRVHLRTWDNWVREMNLAFRPNQTILADQADHYKWDGVEDICLYFYKKLSLLRLAYPDRPTNSFVRQIKAGIPLEVQDMIRTDFSHNPETKYLLNELRGQEEAMRNRIARNKKVDAALGQHNNRQLLNATRSTPAATSTPVKEVARTQMARRYNTADLKASFKAEGLFREGNVYKYRIPGTNDVMILDRPCRHCREQHWDWMCQLLKAKGSSNNADAGDIFWIEKWDDQDSTGDSFVFASIEAPPSAKITEIPSPSTSFESEN